jgi:DNA polymerase-4
MGDMIMVGRAASRRLSPFGIRTIGDIARCDITFLEDILGSNGRTLWHYANGLDVSPVSKVWETPPPKSVGNSFTLPADISSLRDVKTALTALCVTVSSRLRAEGMICRTVQLSVRDSGLKWYERQMPLRLPCRTSGELLEAAFELYRRYPPEQSVRSLGVRAVGLSFCESEQMSILPDLSRLQRRERLESVCDDIRRKYGKSIVSRAVLMENGDNTDFGRLTDMNDSGSGCSFSKRTENDAAIDKSAAV